MLNGHNFGMVKYNLTPPWLPKVIVHYNKIPWTVVSIRYIIIHYVRNNKNLIQYNTIITLTE